VKQGKTLDRLNRKHAIIAAALERAEDPRIIKALLRLVEETVPVPLIYIQTAEQPKAHAEPFETASSAQVRTVMQQVFNALVESGHKPGEARQEMARIDPFGRFPELLETMDTGPIEEDIED